MPVELTSSTENDSRREFKRTGGSLARLSPAAIAGRSGDNEGGVDRLVDMRAGGGGSMCDLDRLLPSVCILVGVTIVLSCSSSDALYDCFNLEGEDSGDGWALELVGELAR